MDHIRERSWVPKVHPLNRDVEPDDPLELVPHCVAGDPAQMLDSILQEFAGLGCNADELMALFRHANYPLLHELRTFYGEEEIRRQVDQVISRFGVLRFREQFAEPDESPELVEIMLDWRNGG